MKRQLYEGGGIMSLSKEGIGGGDYRGIDMGSRAGFGIIKKITRGYTSFSPGETRSLIKLDLQFEESLILPLICYEIIYPGKIKTRKQFPNLIINISEDAWFMVLQNGKK